MANFQSCNDFPRTVVHFGASANVFYIATRICQPMVVPRFIPPLHRHPMPPSTRAIRLGAALRHQGLVVNSKNLRRPRM